MKHFKLTSNTKVNELGITLFQVELTIDCKFGKKRDLGGWVEREENLKGKNAWLGINAEICLKGVIIGGEIWGGKIWGGEIMGGEIWGGVIMGGEIWDGKIWGGVIIGGEIWGGEIWGGEIMGGEIIKSPLQFCFSKHFGIVCKPNYLKIGCKEFSFEYWNENFKSICESENYNESEIETYAIFIQLALKIGNDCFEKDENGIPKMTNP